MTIKLLQGLILLSLIFAFSVDIQSQSFANYSVVESVEPWQPITGTLQTPPGANTAGIDGGSTSVNSIGFTFPFDSRTFTTWSADVNGHLKLGGAVASVHGINPATSTVLADHIAPYTWDAVSTSIYAQMQGTSPNRVLVVQWNGFKWWQNAGTIEGQMQVRLYENGLIQIVYGPGISSLLTENNAYVFVCGSDPGLEFKGIAPGMGGVPMSVYTNRTSPVPVTQAMRQTLVSGKSFFFTADLSLLMPPSLSLPSNLATVAPTNISLNWFYVPLTESYNLQVSASPDFASTVINQTGINSTNYLINSLEYNTQYYWRVQAQNGEQTSNWSEVRSFTTVDNSPQAVTLSAPANSSANVSNSPQLIWNSALNAVNYRVQVSLTEDFSNTVYNEIVSGTSFNANALQNNTKYYWRVCSKSLTDSSAWSAVWSFTTWQSSLSGNTLLMAWGWNENYQLGDSTLSFEYAPKLIGTSSNWASVSAGGSHTLAIKTGGTLWAWGKDDYGQRGDGTSANRKAPVQIGTGTNWASVSAGYEHSIAIKSEGTLWAWGYNSSGQLGDGTTTLRNTPVQVGTDTDWASVSAGSYHTLAIKSNGTLWAWGYNSYCQLGDGTNTDRNTPVQIGTDTDWASLSAGGSHTLAIKSNGTLWAWGNNSSGQLGDGTTTSRNTPVQIGTDADWTSVSAGSSHTLAIKSNGTLWAWGDNSYGKLGDGTNTDRNTPVQVGTDTDWVSVSAGSSHTLAIKSNGTLWAWGKNNYGQLGDGTGTNRTAPVLINSGGTCRKVEAGGNSYSIALFFGTYLVMPSDNSLNQTVTPQLQAASIPGASLYSFQVSEYADFSAIIYEANNDSSYINIPAGKLNFGTIYYWRVNVSGPGGTSNYSTPFKFTTVQTIQTLPANNASNQSLTRNLQWTAVNGAESYSIQISTNIDFTEGSIVHTEDAAENTYTVPAGKLNFGTIYYWRVNVSGPGGTSNYSTPFKFTTVQTIQTLPANNASNQSLTPNLQWTAVNGASGYSIQISRTADFAVVLSEVNGVNSIDYTVPAGVLNSNFDYYWRLAVEADQWKSNWSSPFKFTTLINFDNYNKFSYQGLLTDNNGNPLNGTYNITVKIYEHPSNAGSLWSETHNVTITNGVFNLILGSITPMNLTFTTSYWLGLSINDGTELTPRTPMVGNIYK